MADVTTDVTLPVCKRCNDTHMIEIHGGVTVMCTSCPVPCNVCRSGGRGPFCATTPCSCSCHRIDPRKR
jgi:hypothetical protein